MASNNNYQDFILLNPRISFHAGGLMNTYNHIQQLRDVTSETRFLDYGCGTGLTLMYLNKLGYKNSIGFDVNPEFIYSANFRFSQELVKPTFTMDFLEVLAQGNIEVVLMESVLAFVGDDDLEVIKNNLRQLHKNGHLRYLVLTDLASCHELDDTFMERSTAIYDAKKIRTRTEIKAILESIAEVGEIMYYNEQQYVYSDDPVIYVDDQQENAFLEVVARNKFSSLEEAKNFRITHANAIKDFGREFCEKVLYFNAAIKFNYHS
jgi:SAM-dependent methyltransferase